MSMHEKVEDRLGGMPGDGVFDAYRPIRTIGVGGFGEVWEVERGRRRYAMKVPRGMLSVDGRTAMSTVAPSLGSTDAFKTEALHWSTLTDEAPDAVVKLIDFNVEPSFWMVMELADEDLEKAIDRGAAGPEDVAQILDHLGKIHSLGVIHRDLKPKNILRVGDSWKISDFGLSKSFRSVSSSGSFKGTPEYMAPEQISKKRFGDIDSRTDIWQIGILLHRILTGRFPYDTDEIGELTLIIPGDGPDVSKAPVKYRAVLEKALKQDKDERYQTAEEFASALRAAMETDAVDDIDSLKRAAEDGDANAQLRMGMLYYSGKGVERSLEDTFKWFSAAAQQNNPEAQFRLASMYEKGEGIKRSLEDAAEWYSKAAANGNETAARICGSRDNIIGLILSATNGDADSQFRLGLKYDLGDETEVSYEGAAKWYKTAADQGDARAENNLGELYYSGRGVKQSYDDAFRCYSKAADKGHSNAMYSLGWMYDHGQGTKKSKNDALRFYRLSAESGNSDAQLCLGDHYYSGNGVKKSYGDALKWYRLAARKDNPWAQYDLGWMYEKGQGVQKSKDEAIDWYNKSYKQGNKNAEKRLKKIGGKQ